MPVSELARCLSCHKKELKSELLFAACKHVLNILVVVVNDPADLGVR